MSQADSATPTAAPAADEGFLGKLFGLYFSPTEAFRSILARPVLGAALMAFVALNLVFTVIWAQKVNPREFMRGELEKSAQYNNAPPEQQAAILDMQSKFFPVILWASPVIVLVATVAIATALMLLFKMFFSGGVTFKQSLTVVIWSGLAIGLVSVPLMVLIMALKGDWSVNPSEVVMANLAALLDRTDTPKALYALASSIDLFSFWTIFLYACGYAVALRRPVGSALGVIVGGWVLVVLIKVGWTALMG
jgi:hypothetical protein